MKRYFTQLAMLLSIWLLSNSMTLAHESPIDHVDRTVRMTIVDGRLDILYRVEIAERNALLQAKAMDTDGDGKISDDERLTFFASQTAQLANRLELKIDVQPLVLSPAGEVQLDPRLGQTFHFSAELGKLSSGHHHIRLTDYHARYTPGPYRLLQPPMGSLREMHLELKERPQLVDLERHPGLVVIDFEIVVPEASVPSP